MPLQVLIIFILDKMSRISRPNFASRNIMQDNAARSDHGVIANMYISDNYAVAVNGNIVAKCRSFVIFAADCGILESRCYRLF